MSQKLKDRFIIAVGVFGISIYLGVLGWALLGNPGDRGPALIFTGTLGWIFSWIAITYFAPRWRPAPILAVIGLGAIELFMALGWALFGDVGSRGGALSALGLSGLFYAVVGAVFFFFDDEEGEKW